MVDPFALSTPVALAGPGVSSPTAMTSSAETPAVFTAIASPSAICCRQIVRTLDAAGRMLAQPIDEEVSVEVDERVVDGGAAEVDARDELHADNSIGNPRRCRVTRSAAPVPDRYGRRSDGLALDALADVLDGLADVALHGADAFAHVARRLVGDALIVQPLVGGRIADGLLGLALDLLDFALDFVACS